jgi:hypothetical protein
MRTRIKKFSYAWASLEFVSFLKVFAIAENLRVRGQRRTRIEEDSCPFLSGKIP